MPMSITAQLIGQGPIHTHTFATVLFRGVTWVHRCTHRENLNVNLFLIRILEEKEREREREGEREGGGAYQLLPRFVCLFGVLTSSSTTRLYRGRAPRQSV